MYEKMTSTETVDNPVLSSCLLVSDKALKTVDTKSKKKGHHMQFLGINPR